MASKKKKKITKQTRNQWIILANGSGFNWINLEKRNNNQKIPYANMGFF